MKSSLHVPPGRQKQSLQTHLRPLVRHPKVELILVPVGRLLAQTGEPVLLRVVVSRAEHVVLVLLEDPEPRAVCELRPLLVVPPVQRVAEGGHRESSRGADD